jgi:hypothetical protein
MISRRLHFTGLALVGMAALLTFPTSAGAQTGNTNATTPTAPTPIGAWFGIARPCPADSDQDTAMRLNDSAIHADLCKAVCNGPCPNAGILPPEVPMMPTLLADGTVLADDAGEIGRYHTTAHGKWEVSSNDGLPDRSGTTRYRATFFWLGSLQPSFPGADQHATCCFQNSVRPRFVTYFDPKDPDRMLGFIQPYLFGAPPSFGPQFVSGFPSDPRVVTKTTTDLFLGNHIPAVDALGGPLPPGCDLSKGCLGTYHFVIRRVPAE